MKIKIQSDFRDCYDHAFCGSHETPDAIFQRQSRGGMNRQEMFSAFDRVGLMTPRHGLVRDLVPALQAEYSRSPKKLLDIVQVVVHLDEQAHAGEGKLALSMDEALSLYPGAFAVEFLPTIIGNDALLQKARELFHLPIPNESSTVKWVGGTSFRHLRIGRRMFRLRYTSQDDWRSNCGENVQIDFLCDAGIIGGRGDGPGLSEQLFFDLSPMVAVDYLLVSMNMYAIDLNVAPGLRDTGVERILRPADVLHEVESWFERKRA